MRTTAAALVLVCAAALLSATVLLPAAAQADTVRRTLERSAPAGARVRVENSTGDVHITGDDGTTVRVTAQIRASSDAAAAGVTLDVARNGGESVVRVNVPQSSPSFVHWLFDRRHISVDLVVRMPRRSALVARLSTGDLDVRDVAATVDAQTSTGNVRLRDVAADASAATSTGDVLVELAPGWNGRLTARSSTGDVRIHAPAGLHARVEARTSVGSVRNALGNAGAAAPVIDARTSVGDVTITTR
jgi:Putative adhesin